MNRDIRDAAHRGGAFLGAAKIERIPNPEAAQHLDIGFGKMAEMVGAKNLPPADGAAVSGGIAAEVAKIAGAGEIEVAGRKIWHWISLGHPARRRNDGTGISPDGMGPVYSWFSG